MTIMPLSLTNFLILSLLLFSSSDGRRFLHEPLFPIQWTPPPPPPDQSDEEPFPASPTAPSTPFFPDSPVQPTTFGPPDPAAAASARPVTARRSSPAKIVAAVSLSLLFLALVFLSGCFLYRHRFRDPPESKKLFTGRARLFRSPRAPDVLYLGTMDPSERRRTSETTGSPYRKLNSDTDNEPPPPPPPSHRSPQLQPLPPLVGSQSSAQDHALRKDVMVLAVQNAPRSWRTSPRMQLDNSPNPPPPPPPPPPTPPPPPPPPPVSRQKLLRPLPSDTPRFDLQIPARRLASVPADHNGENFDEEDARPRLKPLHWDKVRASSDRATAWDQLKSTSFQLDEDTIETLFVNNSTNPAPKETNRRQVFLSPKMEKRVLDPKKSQNIAILLRALNVTREEVSNALLDGNSEGLDPDLLETLVKMAPTKEEELKLRDYNGDVSNLGSAERFLKAILDVPFAFRRVDAMLYRANFETEVKYILKSFETLEAACEDLRGSRQFLKLLEAVLRTGNRINIGTNRGEAKAFKLDTLLKLADVKGTDGKTTLLHFVVQEIIRSEEPSSNIATDDPRNKGLKLLTGLSGELGNVKKAAGMDLDVLHSYVKKLELGLEKIRSVLQLERSCEQDSNFFESMSVFLREAESEIGRVKGEEKNTMGLVSGITEYFHGDAGKEEAHPLRIFMVVRDFLLVLDHVCKDVGKRAMVGSARSFGIS